VKSINKLYFLYPILLVFVSTISVLLSANVFVNSEYTFAVWFLLMLATFSLGWLMYSGFGWGNGSKIVLGSIAISIVFSLIVVAGFTSYLDTHNSLIGNLVLYTLRTVVLGFSGLFGLLFAENTKHRTEVGCGKNDIPEEIDESQKAEYYIKEAKLQAEKIIFNAEKDVQELNGRKAQIEIQLRELIHTEREVIRKYESEDITNKKDDESES